MTFDREGLCAVIVGCWRAPLRQAPVYHWRSIPRLQCGRTRP